MIDKGFLVLTKDCKALVSVTPIFVLIRIMPIISWSSGAVICWTNIKGNSVCAFILYLSNTPGPSAFLSPEIPDGIFPIRWYVVGFPIDGAFLQFVVTKIALMVIPRVVFFTLNVPSSDTLAAFTWKTVKNQIK